MFHVHTILPLYTQAILFIHIISRLSHLSIQYDQQLASKLHILGIFVHFFTLPSFSIRSL